MRSQRVQERVTGGVAALPGIAEHTGRRREHHELRGLGREIMQVQRRVDLGPQHPVDPLRRQGLDHAVIEHTGRVHHTPNLVLLQQLPQRGPVRDVAGDNGNPRPQRLQLTHVTLSTTADQHQLGHPVVLHQVPRHDPAQPTRTAGDENRAIPHSPVPTRNTAEPRRPSLAVTDHQLRLVEVQHPEQRRQRRLLGIEVDQPEPFGMLGLRRPQQPPHRRTGQVITFDRTARDEHEPPVAVLPDPLLHQLQRPVRHGLDRLGVLLPRDRHEHNIRVSQRKQALDTPDREPEHVRPEHADCPARLGRRHRDRRPPHREQRVQLGRLLRRDRPHHQRLDRRHRVPGRVGERDPHPVVVARHPDPQRRGPGRVQRHVLPGERQPGRPALVQQRRVQRGVQQRRVQPELPHTHVVRQRDLGIRGVTVPPSRPQPAEHAAISEPGLSELLVAALDINHFRGRRPHRRVELDSLLSLGQHTADHLSPLRVGNFVRPHVNRERPALVPGGHLHLQRQPTVLR